MALGKGLGAILEEVGQAYENEMFSTDGDTIREVDDMIEQIDVSLVDPNPYQPRKDFDEEKLLELSESIQRHGLLQPIVVVSVNDRYILVAGERRLRAHKLANLDKIKAIIADLSDDEIRMRELALIENIQREDLNPIELAHSYQELITVHKITHEELSQIVHKSRSQITNTLRLLSLDEYVSQALIDGKITQGHAKVMVGLDPKKQKILTDTIIGQKLSVRDAEEFIKRVKGSNSIKREPQKSFKISKENRERIEKLLPVKSKIKSNKIEIVLQNEDEVMKFIIFLENR